MATLLPSLMLCVLCFQRVLADPVEVDSFSRCSMPRGSPYIDCCQWPRSEPIVDFKHDARAPRRIREAAHLLRRDAAAKMDRAYALMRSLPADDRRHFLLQSDLHCAYCLEGFFHANTTTKLRIHDSWLFLPWHRWFLYFHERILAKLLGDDSFAIPYWNWDNQATQSPLPNTIPLIYLEFPGLRNPYRSHLPPRIVDLDYVAGMERNESIASTRARNSGLMYRQLVSGARSTALFFGGPYRAGDSKHAGRGTLEISPHNSVHDWTGSPARPNREDMGTLGAAGRDPLFYAHHANVDRLWAVWKTLPGGSRKDPVDRDWLDTKFVFFDENARLVRVRLGDALTPEALGYSYAEHGNPWARARPTIRARDRARGDRGRDRGEIEELGEAIQGRFKELRGPFQSRVHRHFIQISRNAEEVLVIQGVELKNTTVKFDVFIDLPHADENLDCNVVECAGTFTHTPYLAHGERGRLDVRLGISETLDRLGLLGAEYILVTIVPKVSGIINFQGFKIEHE